MKKRKLVAFLLSVACVAFSACGQTSSSNSTGNGSSESSSSINNQQTEKNVLAHWKLQDVEGCYTGDIDTDALTFIDLTGNGNDIVVASEGNGDQLDIFSWDSGFGEGATSLKFNNTFSLAESVDPYQKSETTYSGAYVSGKYLETVDNAPINDVSSLTSWSIEIIFKISSEWNNAYNRYTGIFSRQGVSQAENEPYFSMAVASASDNVTGAVGQDNAMDLQLVHANKNEGFLNKEFGVEVFAEEWVHYMVVGKSIGNRNYIIAYINGKMVFEVENDCSLAESNYGWEIGVGRKAGQDAATKNPYHPEGLIRRLFCGSISEIKFHSNAINLEESLFYVS